MSNNHLNIDVHKENKITVVNVDGRVDGYNSSEFHRHLKAANDTDDLAMLLNLEQLSYISSAGLRVLLLMAKTMQSQKAKLAVCSLAEPIREVFSISGFDQIIPVYTSSEEALKRLFN